MSYVLAISNKTLMCPWRLYRVSSQLHLTLQSQEDFDCLASLLDDICFLGNVQFGPYPAPEQAFRGSGPKMVSCIVDFSSHT